MGDFTAFLQRVFEDPGVRSSLIKRLQSGESSPLLTQLRAYAREHADSTGRQWARRLFLEAGLKWDE
jgi:hypothetical protein